MRKIDGNSHHRFITALEEMIQDLQSLGHPATADDLAVSGEELEELYRHYDQKIKEVNTLIHTYYDLFEEKHSQYVQASRLRQKENTRLRRKQRQNEEQNR